MVASVPELTSRTSSAAVRATSSSASSTSPGVGVPKLVPRAAAAVTASTTAGCACPWISGPHEQTRSTYRRPSASVSQQPWPRTMNRGVPPTARKARTGELTPPGTMVRARSNRACEAGASGGYAAAASVSVTAWPV